MFFLFLLVHFLFSISPPSYLKRITFDRYTSYRLYQPVPLLPHNGGIYKALFTGLSFFSAFRFRRPLFFIARSFSQKTTQIFSQIKKNTSSVLIRHKKYSFPSSFLKNQKTSHLSHKTSSIRQVHTQSTPLQQPKSLCPQPSSTLPSFFQRKKIALISGLTSLIQSFKSFFDSHPPPSMMRFSTVITTQPFQASDLSSDSLTFFHGTQFVKEICQSGLIKPHLGLAGKIIYMSSSINEAAFYAQQDYSLPKGGVFALQCLPSRQFHLPNYKTLHYFVFPDNLSLYSSLRAIFLYPDSYRRKKLISKLYPQTPLYLIENQLHEPQQRRVGSIPLSIFDPLTHSPLSDPPYMSPPPFPYHYLYWPIQNFSQLSDSLILPADTPLFSCRINAIEQLKTFSSRTLQSHLWFPQADRHLEGNQSGLSFLKLSPTDCELHQYGAVTKRDLDLSQTAESILFLNPQQMKETAPTLPSSIQKKNMDLVTTFRGPSRLYDALNQFCFLFICFNTTDSTHFSSEPFIFSDSSISPTSFSFLMSA